ncbi:Hypothetical protein PHPALM_17782 [Phytophthora palmivora]|uniref:Uncharacterized protein n=1 Tax=Phytophthora palmivora TaxID=4796 RepID=A0A2P4XLC9_9STRA|nr:Hypothetical protein PHPALM_17782 [Phytophthora palmivora]
MMPPFRRPAPPPPPAASGRRSLGDLLPRRSLLALEVRPSDEEFAKGRDSDERKSDVEPQKDKRDRRPRKKRRSRILSDLRPVEGPESALPSVPAIYDDDSQVSENPLDSCERANEAFAAQREECSPDVWHLRGTSTSSV